MTFFLAANLAVLLLFNGCLDKDSGQELTTIEDMLPDDREYPARPSWSFVQPEVLFSVEDQYGARERHFGVHLEWTRVLLNTKGNIKENIIGYKIYRDSKQKAIGVVLGQENTTYEDRDLDALVEDSKHTYYVSALDSKARETFSDAQGVELKVGGQFPSAPRNFFILANGDQVTLYWYSPENLQYCLSMGDEVTAYRINRRAGSGDWETIAWVPVEKTMFVDGNINSNDSYSYQLFAVTRIGNVGPGSAICEARAPHLFDESLSAPTAPEGLTVVPAEIGIAGALKLSWKLPKWNDNGGVGTASTGAVVGYKIYRFEAEQFERRTIENIKYQLVGIVYNKTEYFDQSIDYTLKNKWYFYKVSAVNTRNYEGELSHPAGYYLDVSTSATKTPESFRVEVNDKGELTFYWKLAAGVEEYYIYHSLNTRDFEQLTVIDSHKTFADYKDGDIVSFKPGVQLPYGVVRYYKLMAFDNVNHFSSNKTYYLKAEKVGPLQNNRLILYPQDFVGIIEARSLHYAWYARQFYGRAEVAQESFWNFDIQRGLHYKAEIVDDSGSSYLVLDAMAGQPPPAQTPEQVFSAMAVSQEIFVSDYIYTDLSSTVTTELGTVDSVRPIFEALPRTSTHDSTEVYYYLSAYNDDGLSYWKDLGKDNVTLSDFLYDDNDMVMLQHGMEGDVIKLNYDVDPWTYYGRAIDLTDIRASVGTYPDFWPTLTTYDGAAPYDMTSRNLLNDWDTEKHNGGCAYFIGPHSGRKFMARDFFGEWLYSGNTLQVRWAGNYFGPWYAGTWPGTSEILLNDITTGTPGTDALARPIRKDNALSWDAMTLEPVDFTSGSFSNTLRDNNYDMYQDQFRFRYYAPESGSYKITMYFSPEAGKTGNYLMCMKKNGKMVSSYKTVNYLTESVSWDLYCFNTDKLEFYFYSLGSQDGNGDIDVFGAGFQYDGSNSPCQVWINRIEFYSKS